MNSNDISNGMISIIIPVYNMEQYLRRCLDNILVQTYDNFEVLCVNDGSVDESGKICEEYKEKDTRIKVFHIEKQGVSYARNYALERIKGDWFCFIDADDWVEQNYLEILLGLAVNNKAELAACSFQKNYQYIIGNVNTGGNITVFNSVKECIHNFICKDNSMHGMSTNKLYNTKKFGGVRFDTALKINEDCLYTYYIMSNCDKACLTSLPLYHWYIRADSACHVRRRKVDFSSAEVFLKLLDMTENMGDEEVDNALKANYIYHAIGIMYNASYSKDDEKVAEAKARCRKWKKHIWSILDLKSKIKYILVIDLEGVFRIIQPILLMRAKID